MTCDRLGGGGSSNQNPSSGAASPKKRSEPEPPYKGLVKGIFLFFNLGFMVFMAATGALGIASANSVNDTGAVFVGIYMILFAAIVFIYEVAQIFPSKKLDDLIKVNFGFLYGIIGKGLFILL